MAADGLEVQDGPHEARGLPHVAGGGLEVEEEPHKASGVPLGTVCQ